MNTDLTSKEFATARAKGYMNLADEDEHAWKDSLVGVYLMKFPNRTMDLDILREVTGKSMPDWEDITDRVMKNYRDATLERISQNTARTVFARIKSVLNDMKEEVDIPSTRYSDILKAKKEPTQNVYLTEQEVTALDELEVHGKKEKYVKAVFLISCYTGCRHSDAIRLTTANINKELNTISYVSKKTRIEAVMPCHKNLLKYINTTVKNVDMWDYEFNNILRDLCEKAGITSEEKVFKAGKEVTAPKFNLVSSHTARRSFVTNLYLRDVDLETIAKMAGHTDSTMTSRYLCARRTLSNQALAFFN